MTVTLYGIFLVWELKINIGGLTNTSVPVGGSTTTWYIEFVAPTLVTVLVRTVEFLRYGIVMEGKFTSRIETVLFGQAIGCPVNREIAELSYSMAQRYLT